MRLEDNNRREVGRPNSELDREESGFTLLSLIPGSGLLVRLWFWLMLQWRAFRIQCARCWFHFSRGHAIRVRRDRQHRSAGVMAASARKAKAAPTAFYHNYRDHRAWLFTTVCGTIGIILLIFLFLRTWWQPTSPGPNTLMAGIPETELGEPEKEEPLLIITDLTPVDRIGDGEIQLQIEPLQIVRAPLNEEFVETTPRMLSPLQPLGRDDKWIAWQGPRSVAPRIDFSESQPTVTYDPPEEEVTEEAPSFSLELPAIPEQAEPELAWPEPEPEVTPEPLREPVEKITIKKQYPQGVGESDNPTSFSVVIANEGETHLNERMFRESIPEGYRLVQPDRLSTLAAGTLFWTVRDLAPGEQRELKIERIPVRREPAIELTRQPEPAKPHLTVHIDQPRQVRQGEIVPIKFHVRNKGQARVTNVVLQTELPDELEYPRGRQLSLNIPALDPGESQTFRLTTKAVRSGRGKSQTELSATDFQLALNSDIDVLKPAPRSKAKPAPQRIASPPARPPVQYFHPMPWRHPCCQPRMGLMWWGPRMW